MEMIRKQTVLNIIDNIQFGDCGTATERLTKLYDTVENLSPADSVEVVRCRDCKWWKRWARTCAWYSYSHIMIHADDYCSHGERKTDV